MSQKDFLRSSDASAFAMYKRAGMADAAAYVAPDLTRIDDITVMLDHGPGEESIEAHPRTALRTMKIQAAEVPNPEVNGTIEFDAPSTDVYKIVKVDPTDDSLFEAQVVKL